MHIHHAISVFPPLFFLFFLVSAVSAIATIEIHGNKFFNSTDGAQFFIKGVAYQRARKEGIVYDSRFQTGYIDSLAEPLLCLRDLELLRELGVNTVRVYQIDPAQNHDVCMEAFASYGIYVLADLSEPEQAIDRETPLWDVDLYQRYVSVVDAMASYDNVLGFYVGNEVVTTSENTDAAPFVRAAVRDVRQYMAAKKYRMVPVGYASNDDADTRLELANYFVCGDTNEVVDFYSINMFEWCGYSLYATSGYKQRTVEFSQLPVPVFFSEFGCNTVTPRPFTEVEALYGPAMLRVWSGGVVYEFFQNANSYGLVEETALGELTKLDDFRVVQLRFMESRPQGVTIEKKKEKEERGSGSGKSTSVGSSGSGSALVRCPARSPKWKAAQAAPTPSAEKCECLQASLLCTISPYHPVHETKLLKEVCEKTDCSRILADGSLGRYGDFSDCGIEQRISFALNEHWLQNLRAPELCDFDSRAALMFSEADLRSAFSTHGRNCKEIMGDLLTKRSNSLGFSGHLASDRGFYQRKTSGASGGAFGAARVALLGLLGATFSVLA